MIYTVTFNPSLDYIVSVKDFKLWNTNRTDTELMLPGGKGLNVSTVLKNLAWTAPPSDLQLVLSEMKFSAGLKILDLKVILSNWKMDVPALT